MGFIEHMANQGNVVAAETGRLFPLISIAIQPDQRQSESGSGLRSLPPDADNDESSTDFILWSASHDHSCSTDA